MSNCSGSNAAMRQSYQNLQTYGPSLMKWKDSLTFPTPERTKMRYLTSFKEWHPTKAKLLTLTLQDEYHISGDFGDDPMEWDHHQYYLHELRSINSHLMKGNSRNLTEAVVKLRSSYDILVKRFSIPLLSFYCSTFTIILIGTFHAITEKRRLTFEIRLMAMILQAENLIAIFFLGYFTDSLTNEVSFKYCHSQNN